MKRVLSVLLTAALLAGMLSGCSNTPEQEQSQTALKEGESELYGSVISITGNELVLKVGTPQENTSGNFGGGQMGTEGSGAMQPPSDGASGDAAPEDTVDSGIERPNRGTAGKGEQNASGVSAMNAGGADSFQPPEGFTPGEGMENAQFPEGFTPGENMPDGKLPDNSGSGSGAQTMQPGGGMQMGVTLTYTGEERTILLPVKTPVTVTMGNSTITTDFTRISVDNTLRMVVSQQEDGEIRVVSVQILG